MSRSRCCAVAGAWLSLCLLGACAGGNGPQGGTGGAGNAPGATGGTGGGAAPGAGGAGGGVTPPGTGGAGAGGAGGAGQPTDARVDGGGGNGGGDRPPTGAGGSPPSPDAAPPGVAGAVTFDPPGGTFARMVMVKLAAPGAPDAVIHYTTDGSLPTRASPSYRAPLAVTETSMVRAFAVAGGADTAIAASVYLRVADDAATFSSNLPIVVLHTHRGGTLPVVRDGPKVPGSITVLEPPAGGRAQLLGTAAFISRAGMRIRGGSSLRFPQKSYGVELYHGGLDEDDDRAVLGWPSSSDFALIGASRADRSLMRNALAFAVSNEIGRYAPRTRFVEAYLVENGGPVTARHYLGVFTLAERVKQGKTRVAVTKLEANDLAAPAVTGGYVVRIDQHETHFMAGGLSFNFVHPPWDNINVPARQPQRAYIQRYVQEFLDAVARPDFRNQGTGKHYNEYIDVPAFIDHNLLNALFKNVDGLRFSAYFYKDRGGLLAAGPLWDFDRSSGTRFDDEYGQRAAEPREWARGDGTDPLRWNFWGRLFADPTFKAAYGRRWTELSAGAFSVARIHATVDRYAAELREAQARHFARWPEMPATGGHEGEVKILKDWFTARVPWMTSQL